MMNEMIDTQPNERADILKEIRYGLSLKKDISRMSADSSALQSEPISDLLITFNEKFRAAGGKYIPCSTQTLVNTLVQICSVQNIGTLLNTSPDLGKYLKKYNVPHISALYQNQPADAALFFTDMLVARTGAIGFTQEVALYPSVRNLARNLIVVSRECCIFPDLQDALDYQRKRDEGSSNGIVEFLVPRQPEPDELGTPEFTAMNPRIILLMIEDPMPRPEPTVNQPQEEKSNEPENQELAD